MQYITSGITTNPAHEERGFAESELIIRKDDDFDQFVHSMSNDPLLGSIRSPRSFEEEMILQGQVMAGFPMEQSDMLV